MKKKNLILNNIVLSTISLLILVSCDPGYNYNKLIENRSDYNLKVYLYENFNDSVYSGYRCVDSIAINKQSTEVIYSDNGLGQRIEFAGCNSYPDSVLIKVIDNPNLKLKQNLSNGNHWMFVLLGETATSGGGDCECRAYITSDMFE
jgi:hypothetical protein